jgi:hypothetical protein
MPNQCDLDVAVGRQTKALCGDTQFPLIRVSLV